MPGQMWRVTRFMIPALWVVILTMLEATAHSGDLDTNGGHVNHGTGQYHNHQVPSPPPTTTASLAEVTAQRSIYVGKSFRAANGPNVLRCRGERTKRNVSHATREAVLSRDQYRCVICASTYDLEVDHRRALINGGDNRIENLATLCHECHVMKTKMDKSLRRQREKLER